MKTEMCIELPSDELDHVTGGVDNATKTMIMNWLAAVPIVGAFTQTGRTLANAVNAYNGNPLI